MQLLLAMDDAAANWYSYHFHDTLFLNDTSWTYWHVKLTEFLSEDQLHGRACAFCERQVHNEAAGALETLRRMPKRPGSLPAPLAIGVDGTNVQYIAGYTIRCCKEPCHIKIE